MQRGTGSTSDALDRLAAVGLVAGFGIFVLVHSYALFGGQGGPGIGIFRSAWLATLAFGVIAYIVIWA